MAPRRFGPLVLIVLLATGALLARLAWIQVAQHELWAGEAARLVRSGRVLPYRRGDVLDRRGRVLAYDEAVYEVELAYREFRRGHPLGLVAHAASALELRAVPLAEALAQLRPWARALVALSPAELEAFGRGAPLAAGPLRAPATDAPGAELRWGRRGDLAFYLPQLFDLDERPRRELRRLVREGDRARSHLELAAQATGRAPEALLAELDARLERSVADLRELALLLERERDPAEPTQPDQALASLVERLEGWRAAVEDAAASELFAEAAGFEAGRVEAHLLRARFDLGWLAALLRWDRARLDAWCGAARDGWLAALSEHHVPSLVLEVELGDTARPLGARVLDGWALLHVASDVRAALPPGGAGAWRAARSPDDLAVLGELDTLFAAGLPRELAAGFELPPLRASAWAADPQLQANPERLALVARAEAWAPAGAPQADGAELAALTDAWVGWGARCARRGFAARWLEERSRAALLGWDHHVQDQLARALEAAAAARGDAPGEGRVAFAPARLDRAQERALFVLKDRGSRPFALARQPSYALVHLLTRWPDRYAGFQVRDARERVHVGEERPGRGGVAEQRSPAALLLGTVRLARLRDLVLERPVRARLEELLRQGRRTREEERELAWLVQRVERHDAARGGDGIEGYFDPELSGSNGYRELRGLQQLAEHGARRFLVPPVDGADLVLTLDLDLQRAALDTLADPAADPRPEQRDEAWLARPTGAIVLLSPDGDVLAAASFPDFDRSVEDRAERRDLPFERTLRVPAFQPPGSVFKPFVAAWALDRLGLDEHALAECAPLPDGRAGYGGVHCNRVWGHGAVALHEALTVSCNSYFAWVGERFEAGGFAELARELGFGQPTGVRALGERPGLREDAVPRMLDLRLRGREKLLAANGLALVEATPMQVARAMAALATGELPDVRLVQRAGDAELPRRARSLAIGEHALAAVRAGMHAVTAASAGSAHAALGPAELGFSMCAKTGSADLHAAGSDSLDGEERRVRKHSWLAGWFPAEEPVGVLVVFLDETLATAGSSAVWVARQYLEQPAVRAWLAEEGVVPR